MSETLVPASADLAVQDAESSAPVTPLAPATPRSQPPDRPPREPLLARHWPGPAAVGPVPLAAAAGAGVLAAGLVPWGRVGLGWLLAGLAVCAATAAGVRFAGDGPTTAPARRWESLAWGATALVLLAVGGLRAAEWLFGLCLFAAAAATVLAVTGGRTVRGLALGALLVPVAAWRGTAWAYRGTDTLRGRVRPTVRVVPTIAITALVLLVFGALLASADAAFSRLLGNAVPRLDAGSLLGWTLRFAAAAALVLAAVFLRRSRPTVDKPRPVRDRGIRLVEWAAPVGALVALFAGFVGVQLTVLFGGASYVLGPDGPTYAEHARGGFWQLLAVTALTLLVIGVAAWVAPRRTAVERACLRGLLGALAALTLLIVASALFRMYTYQEAYGFTRLRVLVSVVELWLGLVFVLVLVAGVRLRAGWLPRAVVATGVVAVLALAALNPDRFIAERNLDRWAHGGQLDVSYLASLSADAAPALVCLPEPERREALAGIRASLADAPEGWRDANLSRAIARDLLDGDAACQR